MFMVNVLFILMLGGISLEEQQCCSVFKDHLDTCVWRNWSAL